MTQEKYCDTLNPTVQKMPKMPERGDKFVLSTYWGTNRLNFHDIMVLWTKCIRLFSKNENLIYQLLRWCSVQFRE